MLGISTSINVDSNSLGQYIWRLFLGLYESRFWKIEIKVPQSENSVGVCSVLKPGKSILVVCGCFVDTIYNIKFMIDKIDKVSVAPNHFGQTDRSDCYCGGVIRIVHDESTQIKWFEDDTTSNEPLDVLQLEVEIPEKKPKFQMCIKALSSHDNDVEFDIGDTALTVADNHNPEEENFTITPIGATPAGSSTPVGEYVQLAI